jgi:hypothetical protein
MTQNVGNSGNVGDRIEKQRLSLLPYRLPTGNSGNSPAFVTIVTAEGMGRQQKTS